MVRLLAMLVLLAVGGGCVGTVYAVKANGAASRLEQAKTLKADELAEFEYYFARENLLKAQEEAAEASYGDAIMFADLAAEYAEKAIELSRAAHRGSGR